MRNRAAFAALLAVLTTISVSCSRKLAESPLFCLAAAVSPDEEGVRLVVLCAREEGAAEKDGGDGAATFTVLAVTAPDVSHAFEKISADEDAVYTGTLTLYAADETLPDDVLCDLAAYLLNAPQWPLKASFVFLPSAADALKTAAESADPKEWETAGDAVAPRKTENVVAALREALSGARA